MQSTRVREVLAEKPEHARLGTNEVIAVDVARRRKTSACVGGSELLVQYGADTAIVNKEGQTAAHRAERLGMSEVADFLRSSGTAAADIESNAGSPRAAARGLRAACRGVTRRVSHRDARSDGAALRYTWHRRTWAAPNVHPARPRPRRRRSRPVPRHHPRRCAFSHSARDGFDSWRALSDFAPRFRRDRRGRGETGRAARDGRHGTKSIERTRDWDAAIARIAERRLDGSTRKAR